MHAIGCRHFLERLRSAHSGARKAPIGVLAVAIAVTVLGSACQSAPGAAAGLTAETPVLPTATAPSPPLVSAVPATTPRLPSFALPEEERREVASEATPTTSAASEMPAQKEGVDPAASGGEEDSDQDNGAAQPTPRPTFTPPALPSTSPNEHYWFRRPVPQGDGVWTDKYYPYGSTRGGQLRAHHGVEFNVTYNTPILAAAEGTVRVAGSDSEVAYGPHPNFYGNVVVIEHAFQFAGQPLFTLYGHLNEVSVTVGQQVAAQEEIGLSGATGVADGPHVHFEVRVRANEYENTRNPLLWLYPFPDRGTVAGRVVWPNGDLAQEAPVSLNRVDGQSPYYATTTYAGSSVNPDDGWQENFAIDDVVAGFYEVTVRVGDDKVTERTWVYPYQTSFVEIVLP